MHPTLALFTKCSGPAQFHNVEIAELQEVDFSCNGRHFTAEELVFFCHLHTKRCFLNFTYNSKFGLYICIVTLLVLQNMIFESDLINIDVHLIGVYFNLLICVFWYIYA